MEANAAFLTVVTHDDDTGENYPAIQRSLQNAQGSPDDTIEWAMTVAGIPTAGKVALVEGGFPNRSYCDAATAGTFPVVPSPFVDMLLCSSYPQGDATVMTYYDRVIETNGRNDVLSWLQNHDTELRDVVAVELTTSMTWQEVIDLLKDLLGNAAARNNG